ncbi:hypothetical protein JKP88DRAFT_318196 [Tribonema minus]|uniref:Uncharacterized protein n=1 Tax=Tribonema minus TaxID=303371 RepID=A0A835YWH0_9STRA|nr:hypothetical protein JKP88DRAFT_318196 [Tribonema minus]
MTSASGFANAWHDDSDRNGRYAAARGKGPAAAADYMKSSSYADEYAREQGAAYALPPQDTQAYPYDRRLNGSRSPRAAQGRGRGNSLAHFGGGSAAMDVQQHSEYTYPYAAADDMDDRRCIAYASRDHSRSRADSRSRVDGRSRGGSRSDGGSVQRRRGQAYFNSDVPDAREWDERAVRGAAAAPFDNAHVAAADADGVKGWQVWMDPCVAAVTADGDRNPPRDEDDDYAAWEARRRGRGGYGGAAKARFGGGASDGRYGGRGGADDMDAESHYRAAGAAASRAADELGGAYGRGGGGGGGGREYAPPSPPLDDMDPLSRRRVADSAVAAVGSARPYGAGARASVARERRWPSVEEREGDYYAAGAAAAAGSEYSAGGARDTAPTRDYAPYTNGAAAAAPYSNGGTAAALGSRRGGSSSAAAARQRSPSRTHSLSLGYGGGRGAAVASSFGEARGLGREAAYVTGSSLMYDRDRDTGGDAPEHQATDFGYDEYDGNGEHARAGGARAAHYNGSATAATSSGAAAKAVRDYSYPADLSPRAFGYADRRDGSDPLSPSAAAPAMADRSASPPHAREYRQQQRGGSADAAAGAAAEIRSMPLLPAAAAARSRDSSGAQEMAAGKMRAERGGDGAAAAAMDGAAVHLASRQRGHMDSSSALRSPASVSAYAYPPDSTPPGPPAGASIPPPPPLPWECSESDLNAAAARESVADSTVNGDAQRGREGEQRLSSRRRYDDDDGGDARRGDGLRDDGLGRRAAAAARSGDSDGSVGRHPSGAGAAASEALSRYGNGRGERGERGASAHASDSPYGDRREGAHASDSYDDRHGGAHNDRRDGARDTSARGRSAGGGGGGGSSSSERRNSARASAAGARDASACGRRAGDGSSRGRPAMDDGDNEQQWQQQQQQRRSSERGGEAYARGGRTRNDSDGSAPRFSSRAPSEPEVHGRWRQQLGGSEPRASAPYSADGGSDGGIARASASDFTTAKSRGGGGGQQQQQQQRSAELLAVSPSMFDELARATEARQPVPEVQRTSSPRPGFVTRKFLEKMGQTAEHAVERVAPRAPDEHMERVAHRAPEERSAERAPEERSFQRAPEERSFQRAPEERASQRASEECASRPAPEERAFQRAPEERVARRAPEERGVKRAPEERSARRMPERSLRLSPLSPSLRVPHAVAAPRFDHAQCSATLQSCTAARAALHALALTIPNRAVATVRRGAKRPRAPSPAGSANKPFDRNAALDGALAAPRPRTKPPEHTAGPPPPFKPRPRSRPSTRGRRP